MTASGTSFLPLLLLAALGASASASCLARDGTCPGSSQSLLQASKKLNVDNFATLLRNEDASLFSGLDSDEMVDNLQARAEVLIQNGEELTPLERTSLKALNKTLADIIPSMLQGHTKDQAEIDVGVRSIKNCNDNFDEDSKAAKSAKGDVDTAQTDHKDCRGEQSKLKAEAVKTSEELDKFWNGLVLPKKAVAATPSLFTKVQKWLEDNEKPFNQTYSKNALAQAALKQKAAVCDSKQKLLESGFCQWFGRATAASKSYGRCWSQSGTTWATIRKEALASAEGRKNQYVAIQKVLCFMKVIFSVHTKGSKAGEMLLTCKKLSPDTSQFNLTNTVAEAEKNVSDELGSMDSKPGDESWKISVYAGLEGVANVTPCAVAHSCGPDQMVLSHRCVACQPGKTNQAGDDALGPDSNCTAILCGIDQYVSSHTCKSCAAGTKNNGSDDASGADTSCTATLCQAGQRVKNNSCHSCPAGTKNEAGGHNAAGPDTSCDPIKCGEDHYVQSKACHTCPAGKTNAAGDDASKGNTTCDSTLCKANHSVVSNRCKGCPPGKFNAAGDDASGANTTCSATRCTQNQRVVGNACIACPDGTSRPAGDDASGTDTTCSPILCSKNNYVESNACKLCPSGKTNEDGDDASGADTTCKVNPLILVETKKSWADAKAHCEDLGMLLVEIHSKEENQAVQDIAQNNHVWIGGTDSAAEGTWKWTGSNSIVSGYKPWGPSEPNNIGGEDCMELWFKYIGTWNDAPCSTKKKFVCEAKKLVLVDTKKSWADAKAHCEGMRRQLVEIYSKKENQAVLDIAHDDPVWIGGTDSATDGTWKWAGTNTIMSGYKSWATSEPNNAGGREDCLVMYHRNHKEKGTWNDGKCSSKLSFVCEEGETHAR